MKLPKIKTLNHQIDVIEAPYIHVDFVRIRTGHVEGMNTAVLAERMFGYARVESVSGQLVLTAQELELLRRHDQVQKALFRAHRAVAICDAIEIGGHAETHATAVATALVGCRHLVVISKQTELARIACGLGQAEVLERQPGE